MNPPPNASPTPVTSATRAGYAGISYLFLLIYFKVVEIYIYNSLDIIIIGDFLEINIIFGSFINEVIFDFQLTFFFLITDNSVNESKFINFKNELITITKK